MTKYRKKPIVVEARQVDTLDYDGVCDIVRWCGGNIYDDTEEETLFTIPTLEGPLNVSNGDWIIKGVKGEFYPCKPDVFEASYEAV
jgi:hypothetical protein